MSPLDVETAKGTLHLQPLPQRPYFCLQWRPINRVLHLANLRRLQGNRCLVQPRMDLRRLLPCLRLLYQVFFICHLFYFGKKKKKEKKTFSLIADRTRYKVMAWVQLRIQNDFVLICWCVAFLENSCGLLSFLPDSNQLHDWNLFLTKYHLNLYIVQNPLNHTSYVKQSKYLYSI